MPIILKSDKELVKMRRAGRLVAECHALVREAIKPGVTTKQLDTIVYEHLQRNGAKSPFLGYQPPGMTPFPGSICSSVNDVVVHGIPGLHPLQEGDIISVDIGAVLDGYVGDSAWTYPVGRVDAQVQALLDVTEQCLVAALAQARADKRLGDIGAAVQQYAAQHGYNVLREFGGHGVGRRMHEDPHIPNYGEPGTGVRLRTGMTLAIEPMLVQGSNEVVELDDGWTIVTIDGKLSAHFEHTIAITRDGEPEILTQLGGATV
jgi:methionyl aminopeptidase